MIAYLNLRTEKQVSTFIPKNIKIDKVYKDIGCSGINPNREELNKMLNNIEHGNTLYISDISQLSRNLIHLYEIIKRLSAKDVKIKVLNNPEVSAKSLLPTVRLNNA